MMSDTITSLWPTFVRFPATPATVTHPLSILNIARLSMILTVAHTIGSYKRARPKRHTLRTKDLEEHLMATKSYQEPLRATEALLWGGVTRAPYWGTYDPSRRTLYDPSTSPLFCIFDNGSHGLNSLTGSGSPPSRAQVPPPQACRRAAWRSLAPHGMPGTPS